MTCDKVREIITAYAVELRKWPGGPERIIDKPLTEANCRNHLLYMCEELLTWGDERKEKMMRWLGFIQGVLAMVERTPVEVLKETNKPIGA
jgi:hypothetical protein